MKLIDSYSYQCGVIDCFNEMVRAGLKKIALSHPSASIEERNDLIPFSQEICQKYGTHFYAEEDVYKRHSVLFPAPLKPMIPKISPFSIERSIPSNAVTVL